MVANNFNMKPRTVGKIWKRVPLNYEDPSVGAFCASPCKNKYGQKQKYNYDEVREAILLVVPKHRKRSLCKLASAIGIAFSTLHRMKQDKDDNVIAPHSLAVRPHLQDHHQFARVL
jgi:hypothetical protein